MEPDFHAVAIWKQVEKPITHVISEEKKKSCHLLNIVLDRGSTDWNDLCQVDSKEVLKI